MKRITKLSCYAVALILAAVFVSGPVFAARDDVATPKEYGIYAVMGKAQKRMLPNIVFDENGLFYVESNNPQHYLLKDFQYFIVHGKYDMQYLTLNHLLFFQQSPLGKPRFSIGQDVEIDVKKKSDTLWVVKPKGLFGRGYYTLWINDSAWDFIVE